MVHVHTNYMVTFSSAMNMYHALHLRSLPDSWYEHVPCIALQKLATGVQCMVHVHANYRVTFSSAMHGTCSYQLSGKLLECNVWYMFMPTIG
jgi:hypothetical protein